MELERHVIVKTLKNCLYHLKDSECDECCEVYDVLSDLMNQVMVSKVVEFKDDYETELEEINHGGLI